MDDVMIREATLDDAADMARVHVRTWRTTYAGIVPDEHLAALNEERRTSHMRTWIQELPYDAAVFVAVRGGHVVGFAFCGRQRGDIPDFDGELWGIYILQEYQRQGIGRRLAGTVVTHLCKQGCRSMLVWVLAENPWRRFYETLGGEQIREKEIGIGGKALREIAYGWSDIDFRNWEKARGESGARSI
jgi:ribosomal protein S18 acetylase RimI-like enzyme